MQLRQCATRQECQEITGGVGSSRPKPRPRQQPRGSHADEFASAFASARSDFGHATHPAEQVMSGLNQGVTVAAVELAPAEDAPAIAWRGRHGVATESVEQTGTELLW